MGIPTPSILPAELGGIAPEGAVDEVLQDALQAVDKGDLLLARQIVALQQGQIGL